MDWEEAARRITTTEAFEPKQRACAIQRSDLAGIDRRLADRDHRLAAPRAAEERQVAPERVELSSSARFAFPWGTATDVAPVPLASASY